MKQQNVSKSMAVKALAAQLKNPFDPRFVKIRIGATSKDKKKGIPLFYVDAREVMKRLDDVCGLDGWQRPEPTIVQGGCIQGIRIRMPYLDEEGKAVWIEKSDVGEVSKTSPLKGASSDAFKRAAVNFGIGRYLYYIPNQWVELNQYGQFVERPSLPGWALPQENLEDWEKVAIREYNPENDVGLDDVDFADLEAEEEMKAGAQLRAKIVDNLKAKKK